MADTNELIANMMSSLGMEDMNIPELKINQATGGDFIKEAGAKLGALYNSTTGEVMDEVSVQLLHIQKNRTYWGRSDITDRPAHLLFTGRRNVRRRHYLQDRLPVPRIPGPRQHG